MKSLLSICLLVICTSVWGQRDFETINIKISPRSDLYIAGSTNVNKFDCVFDTKLISQPRTVSYVEDDTYIYFENLILNLKINGFDCGNKKMNSDFQSLLESDNDPDIRIKLNKTEFYTEEYIKAYIEVDIAGKRNTYDFPVKLDDNRFAGKLKLNIRDFGLEPPTKAFGLIQVDEHITIHFNLKILD